jgi:hypothetical protein
MDFKKMVEKVVSVAESHVGTQEIEGNMGWKDEKFYAMMKETGWKMSQAWCAYFTELVWTAVYDDEGYSKIFDKLFSGSAQRTLKKFKDHGWPVGRVPEVGAVIIWRYKKNGQAKTTGHAGIVVGYDNRYIYTVEGNTNDDGSREGGVVAKKKRSYAYNMYNGLEIYGFIYPPGVTAGVPFYNSEEGNAFRGWLNNLYPEAARRLDLDRRGFFYNSFIRKAYLEFFNEWEASQAAKII